MIKPHEYRDALYEAFADALTTYTWVDFMGQTLAGFSKNQETTTGVVAESASVMAKHESAKINNPEQSAHMVTLLLEKQDPDVERLAKQLRNNGMSTVCLDMLEATYALRHQNQAIEELFDNIATMRSVLLDQITYIVDTLSRAGYLEEAYDAFMIKLCDKGYSEERATTFVARCRKIVSKFCGNAA